MRRTFLLALGRKSVFALLALLPAACSKADGPKSEVTDAGGFTPRERPAGPSADVSEELSGGNGPFIGAAAGLGLPGGYVEHEYVAAGAGAAYEGQGALTDDGKWTVDSTATADYRTRIIVFRPARNADASGTVIVEWLNVSGGVDANPDYASLAEEIIRQGHTWVGVSAQLIGVEGG